MTNPPSPPSPALGALRWHHARLADLPALELARIYRARQRVFVVEQTCIYLDADALDERSWHLAAWSPLHDEPVAYARIVDPGGHYDEPSIGRVLTSGAARGTGVGRELVARALAISDAVHRGAALRISAQIRLQRFYGGFGFEVQGEPYLEDDMPHIGMWRAPRNATR
jgi:ElaA protein